jgi:hypothetical protein
MFRQKSDDIVTRLEEMLDGPVPFVIGREDIREAADEIERLRKAGDALAQGIRTGQWDDALDAWTEVRGD